ncbi:MAG: hypothetical protein LAT64_08800 [Phycisphaerales bacterium]|nr:hypothetical protein [Planctomycetota bacterium]MCH8508848.1 hypothetical protein [Phycisphaerales bacterium]
MLIPTGVPTVMAGGLVSIGDDAGQIGRRADIATNGFLLLCATGAVLGILLIAREVWSIHRTWWVEELNERSIRVRRGNMTAESAWGELRGFRERLAVLEILSADGRPIRLERVCPARWAVQGRLLEHAPLWSVFFIALLLVAIVGPAGTVWLWRWLQLPPEVFGWPQYLFMQVFLLVPPAGLLAAHWWTNRRVTAAETQGTDPE